MRKKAIYILSVATLFAISAQGATVIFDQDDTVTADWTAGAESGTVTGVDISDPANGITITQDRAWAASDAGIGQLDAASNIVEWTFDFSNADTDIVSDDTYSIAIAATSNTFDGSGAGPADGYLFGTAGGGGNLLFGHSDRIGKNGVDNPLYDTGVSAVADASGSVTISFNPTGNQWTVAGSFNGSSFTSTGSTFTDSTYTGVTTDFLGVYGRGSNTAVTLDNMSVTVIPEPSSFALLAGALALGVIMLRRRRRA